MADDVNKKGGKVNGTAPKAIQEMVGQYERNTSYEASLNDEKLQRLVDKAAEYEEKFNSASPGTAQQQALAEQLAYAEEEAHRYSISVDQALTAKSNKVLARSLDVYSKSGNINRRTTTMAGQQSIRSSVRGGNLFRPTNMIESEIQSDIEAASSLGSSLANEARSLRPGDSAESIRERAGGLSDIEARIARNKALIKIQGREGYSTEKLTNRGEDLDRDVNEFLKRKKIETKINTGDVKSYDEEMKELGRRREERSTAQADYEKAIEDGAAGIESFAEKLHKANEALEEQTRVVKGMDGKGGGGGGIFGRYSGAVQFAQMGFQAIGAVAGAANEIAVNQDITQMGNRGQFARMGNAIYDKADQAVRGRSIDAMLDIASSDLFAKQYGDANKNFTNVAKSVEAGSGIVSSVLGGMGKGAAVGGAAGLAFAGVGAGPGALIGAGIGGVSALANSVPAATNVAYGNEGAASSIASYTAAKQLTAEERHIRAANMQAYYNQGLGLYQSTMGLGSGSLVQSQLMSGNVLSKLGANGISPELAVQLSGMLGSAGSMGSTTGMDIIRSAGRAGQLGQMGREEYVGAASRLVAAGGANSDLENIIAAATTKGMDNSKNISQMVDATTMMSSGLASIGVSGTGVVSNMLGASAQGLVDLGVNKNLATDVAAQGMANYDKAITNNSFTLGSVMQRQRVRTTPGLEGASIFQLNSASTLSMEELAVLRSAEGGTSDQLKQAQLLARRKGLDNLLFKDGKVNSAAVQTLSEAGLEKGLLNVGAAQENRGLINKFRSGEELSPEQRAILNQMGVDEMTFKTAGGRQTAARGTAVGNRLGSQSEATAAAYGAKKIAAGEQAAGEMGQGKAFENIEKLSQTISEAVDPAKWGDEVKKAAEGFAIPAANFVAATGQLDSTVQKLISHQNQMLKAMGELRSVIPSRPK